MTYKKPRSSITTNNKWFFLIRWLMNVNKHKNQINRLERNNNKKNVFPFITTIKKSMYVKKLIIYKPIIFQPTLVTTSTIQLQPLEPLLYRLYTTCT